MSPLVVPVPAEVPTGVLPALGCALLPLLLEAPLVVLLVPPLLVPPLPVPPLGLLEPAVPFDDPALPLGLPPVPPVAPVPPPVPV